MASKLPRTIPQSLRYARPPATPLVKARTHDKKAEQLRDEEKKRAKKGETDPTKPHLQFQERMKAVLFATEDIREIAKKEYRGKLDRDDLGPHEFLGHMIGSLPKPRMDLIFRDERIGKLNALLMKPKRHIRRLIGENEELQDLGIDFLKFNARKQDLKFGLGLQSYKAAQALGLYFVVIRAASDPKVKKTVNLVQDTEVLELANGILREVATHIIEEMQGKKDKFLDVGDRRTKGVLPKGRRV